MANLRKNQKALSTEEWADFIAAINAMHGISGLHPRYRELVEVHVQAMLPSHISWSVHSMQDMGMIGRNFLAWHRQFLLIFEKGLQQYNPTITVPYWDWIADPLPPPQISTLELLSSWSVLRDPDFELMPDSAFLNSATVLTGFRAFQSRLESVHGYVHVAVGGSDKVNGGLQGTMSTSSSPADPIFWLHHANIDRIWAEWQQANPGVNPPNMVETLKPSPLFGMKVSSLIDIATLGYAYV